MMRFSAKKRGEKKAAILNLNCKNPTKSFKTNPDNATASQNKRSRGEMHLFSSREKCKSPNSPPTSSEESMACHTTCFMRTHFMTTVLCSTMPDFPPARNFNQTELNASRKHKITGFKPPKTERSCALQAEGVI